MKPFCSFKFKAEHQTLYPTKAIYTRNFQSNTYYIANKEYNYEKYTLVKLRLVWHLYEKKINAPKEKNMKLVILILYV